MRRSVVIVSLEWCIGGDDMVQRQSGAIERCLVIGIAGEKAGQEAQQVIVHLLIET